MDHDDSNKKFIVILAITGVALAGIWLTAYLVRDAQNRADAHAAYQAIKVIDQEFARASAAMNAKLDAQRQERLAREANLSRQRQIAAQAAADARLAELARENAWKAYYTPPVECQQPGDDWNMQVRCGNHYMQTRNVWEDTYEPRPRIAR